MRTSYNNIQIWRTPNSKLSQGMIERLEEIGFQWKGVDYNEAFEKHCRELMAFKDEFGHCNVRQKFANNPPLGRWCCHMRVAYNKIQKGKKVNYNLSQDRIERLEEIGFEWNYMNTAYLKPV